MNKFYTFNQNNSGGSFDIDENIREYVVIEANSSKEANEKAEEIGVYFDGCETGFDCSCCGDRWYEVDDSDGYDIPMMYSSSPMSECQKSMFRDTYIVYYADGEKEILEFLD